MSKMLKYVMVLMFVAGAAFASEVSDLKKELGQTIWALGKAEDASEAALKELNKRWADWFAAWCGPKSGCAK